MIVIKKGFSFITKYPPDLDGLDYYLSQPG